MRETIFHENTVYRNLRLRRLKRRTLVSGKCFRVRNFWRDNWARAGVATNLVPLQAPNCRVFHGDVRQRSNLTMLPPVGRIIDAAANPSVDGRASSRQVVEHNPIGTLSRQLPNADQSGTGRLGNVGGGLENSTSLAELSVWAQGFGHQAIEADPSERPFDVPWVIMDSQSPENAGSGRRLDRWKKF
jgi:hypothetical protein